MGNPTSHRLKDCKIICNIRWECLDTYWILEPVMVNCFKMLKRIHKVVDDLLGLVEGLQNYGAFFLRVEVDMGVSCLDLILSLRKLRHTGNLQLNRIRKYTMAWSNLYEARDVWIEGPF